MTTQVFRRPLSRRAVLKGAGGVVVGLPFLDAMECRAQATPPKRFAVVFFPCGVQQNQFWPTNVTSETNFTLGPITQVLQPHVADLIFAKGIDFKVAQNGPGDLHQRGMAAFLTNEKLDTAPLFTSGGGNQLNVGWCKGISIDQHIANTVGTSTALKSLEVSVMRALHLNSRVMSYSGPMQPIAPDDSPTSVFNRLFQSFSLPPSALADQKAKRLSVLDAVLDSYHRLDAKLGTADKARLDAHLTSVEEIEQQVLALNVDPGASTCTVPDLGVVPSHSPQYIENFPAIAQLQMDLLVAALACDRTRVASIMFAGAISPRSYPWLSAHNPDTGNQEPITYSHHSITHGANLKTPFRDNMLREIDKWHMAQFKYLLDKLSTTMDAGGTRLLDNMVVLCGNELGYGPSHTHFDIPMILAGNCQGVFNTGRFVQFPQVPHSRLLVTLMNAMGVQGTTFGNAGFQGGPLPTLLA